MITATDVTRGKPDPQVFLLAASQLGVEPRCCVVVEDAPAGVQAAHAAEMVCIGMASKGRSFEELRHAELVVGSLRELSSQTFDRLLKQHQMKK
jgi:beta-phosphoglucomutase-like phosphatase (HAD superfamily)